METIMQLRDRLATVSLPAILLLTPVPLVGQNAQAQSAQGDSVRVLVERFREAHQIPGLAVAVGLDSELVWTGEFGVADVAAGVAVTRDTRFRIGAISMALTSTALGLLVERGAIELDADIQCYVKSFPEKRYPITVEQVAGHTGGIRHYQGDEFRSNRHYPSVLDGLAIFARDSLVFEPGTRYGFSTFGWSLIAAAVEEAAGEDFLQFMQTAVLDPLGLTNTMAERPDAPVAGLSMFYQLVDGEVRTAPPVDNSYKWAGGGFVSTPADLVRFSLALMRGELLRPETVHRLWTSQHTRDGGETGYGIGWSVGRDAAERRVVSHTGGSVGARSMLLVYPDERLVVAITANLERVRFGNLPQTLADHFRR
jgi:CubicO group peptidase (beta-lactamase class C family)